jgi:hypothetical protein
MDYTTRIVKSASGLTQHEALLSLQNHSQFQAGTKIASIHNQGGHWVAKLLVPRFANESKCNVCKTDLDDGKCPICSEPTSKKTATEDVKPCEHCEDKGCQHCKKTASGWGDFGEGLGQAAGIAGDVLSAPIDAAGGVVNSVGSLAQGDIGGAAKELAGGSAAAIGDIGQAANEVANAAGLPAGVTDAAMPNQQTMQQATQQYGTDATGAAADQSMNNNFYKPTSGTRRSAEAFEDIDESPADLHDDMHEMKESPFEEMKEHEGEGSTDKKIAELEKKIDLLLDALGISEKGEDMDEMPEGPSADLPAAPAPKGPKGPKKSEPLPTGSGAKLKPGEVPNKPGMTPVGSPAFASIKSFTASKVDSGRNMSIRMAKAQLENSYKGFRVARIKRAGDTIHARLEKF